MHTKKFIIASLIVLAIFALAFYFSKKNVLQTEEVPRNPTSVSVQSAADSKILIEKRTYPGLVEGVQEIAIVSQISGVVSSAPYEIGSSIKAGALLARIDDAGNLAVGDNGFKSSQIQQSELSAAQAKKSYGLSKDIYHNTKESDDSTKIDKETAKTQKEISQLQYESAKISLQGSIDNHILISPINGFIIDRSVSVGDSVSQGQIIATVSKTSAVKIRFYVDSSEKESFSPGQEISVFNSDKKQFPAIIKNISPQADAQTKRFLVEAYPKTQDSASLLLGTVITVSLEKKQVPQDDNNFILPLSAISITQNENYIFVAEQNVAKKIKVDLLKIMGENAEISAPFAPETSIIIKGNKVLREGGNISVENKRP